VSGNYITSTGATAYAALMTAWKTPVTDQGITFTPAIFSPTDHAFYAIGDMQYDAKAYTDRRRTARV